MNHTNDTTQSLNLTAVELSHDELIDLANANTCSGLCELNDTPIFNSSHQKLDSQCEQFSSNNELINELSINEYLLSHVDRYIDDTDNNIVIKRSTEFRETNPLITYQTKIITKNKPLEISFDDVDTYDFNEGFIEVLEKPELVHLYFDIDKVGDENELRSIITSLKRYAIVFGWYVTGGNINNKHISNVYNLRYIPNENHLISMHVVFPDTCISAINLMNIIHDKGSRIIKKSHKKCECESIANHETNNVNEAFDKFVYKLNSR